MINHVSTFNNSKSCRLMGRACQQMTRRIIQVLLAIVLLEPLVVIASEAPLLMGIFPRRNTQISHKMFSPLSGFLSRELGREVQLVLRKDFASFWAGVKSNQYDIVHFNQYHYMKSHKNQGYKVILHNQEFKRHTLAGALVVRKDSGIDSVSDLKGKSIIFGGGPQAFIAYIATTHILKQAGLEKGMYQTLFARNPPNAAIAAFAGEAAAAGTGDIVLNLGVVKKAVDTSQMKILAQSEQFEHLPWAVKKSMSIELSEKIQQAMVNLSQSDAGRIILKRARINAFIPTDDSDFDRHRQIVFEVLGESF
jgi:phosphonate transport system substrate-binding protein